MPPSLKMQGPQLHAWPVVPPCLDSAYGSPVSISPPEHAHTAHTFRNTIMWLLDYFQCLQTHMHTHSKTPVAG